LTLIMLDKQRGFIMTGTDRIKEKIMEDAKKTAEHILSEARGEAQEIIAAAEKEALVAITKVKASAEEEGDNQKKRMFAIASLEERKNTLKARQDMVDRAFSEAMTKLVTLPDKEYGAFLKAYIIQSVREGAGELLLNETDKKRLGEAFMKELNASFKQAGKNASLTLAQDVIRAKGGFILRYGEMEINSTLEIMMSQLRPQLEVQVANILFKPE